MSGGRATRPIGRGPVLDAVQAWSDELSEGRTVVVAFSGGLDSCVLLHALRFGPFADGARRADLSVAHFDHAMRAGSASDADWAAGLCRAWRVPLVAERASVRLSSEAEARAARYAFLDRVRVGAGPGAVVVTAHHADDQAETVLFRVLRGTGPDGLRGIAARRPGLARPLLGVWREQLEAYAAEAGLRWREDPTNEHLGYARNALRHQVLPLVERSIAPGARRALARLARISEGDAAAWSEVMPMLTRLLESDAERAGAGDTPSLGRSHDESRRFERAALLALGRPLRGRLIRHLVSELGGALDEAGVRRVNDFVERADSGRAVDVGEGVTVTLEPDRVVFEAPSSIEGPGVGAPRVVIGGEREGRSPAVVGHRPMWVVWSSEEGRPRPSGDAAPPIDAAAYEESFGLGGLALPLELRPRGPGDRIRLAGGSRKVKKLLLEHRIPVRGRDALPMLVDRTGEVLWIPGVARSTVAVPTPGEPFLRVRIEP